MFVRDLTNNTLTIQSHLCCVSISVGGHYHCPLYFMCGLKIRVTLILININIIQFIGLCFKIFKF